MTCFIFILYSSLLLVFFWKSPCIGSTWDAGNLSPEHLIFAIKFSHSRCLSHFSNAMFQDLVKSNSKEKGLIWLTVLRKTQPIIVVKHGSRKEVIMVGTETRERIGQLIKFHGLPPATFYCQQCFYILKFP